MYRDAKNGEEQGSLDEEDISKYKKSGKISSEVLEYGRELINNGERVVDVLDKIEEKVGEMSNISFAFPPQISLDDTAAHNCPDIDDETVFDDNVVKLDLGVHVDGCVTDNALTVDLSGEWTDLVKASREAVEEAVKMAKPGVKVSEIGGKIQEIIESYDYNPVRNLSGHGVGHFTVHTSPSIPNFDNNSSIELEEDMTIAIEPFASDGAGVVYESGEAGVFSLNEEKPVRSKIVRNALEIINEYQGLPFAKKWLSKRLSKGKANLAIRKLLQKDIVNDFPPLVDKQKGMVSQAERTVLVKEDPIVLTNYNV